MHIGSQIVSVGQRDREYLEDPTSVAEAEVDALLR
jgi:hypothetical protein